MTREKSIPKGDAKNRERIDKDFWFPVEYHKVILMNGDQTIYFCLLNFLWYIVGKQMPHERLLFSYHAE